MKIAVVGAGYVGLVTGTCFSESGNEVRCIDIDEAKIERLNRGDMPIYEPGLEEIVERNIEAGRLSFTTDVASAVADAKLVFLAVGTPPADDGSADLTALWAVVRSVAPHLNEQAVVVIKSTVPVGTNAKALALFQEILGRTVDVASNPEFLKEGAAVNDCMFPDRVVVGVRRAEASDVLRQLYEPFLRTGKPFLVMSPESAEMAKYAANAMLSTKISFINETANLCELLGADINDVRSGMGHDSRIGFAFLFPGVGYGGSCFPKDVRALSSLAVRHGMKPRILDAVDKVNQHQKRVLIKKMEAHFGAGLQQKTIAIWGLAFKPRTDDIREAPALVLIDWLLEQGARVRVYDPEALDNVRAMYGDKIEYGERPLETLNDADALAICTEWDAFRQPDFAEMRNRMAAPVVFDGRNLYKRDRLAEAGFTYFSIGRATVIPESNDK